MHLEERHMAGKFCVTQTYAKNDADKATVGFVIANAALGSDKETMVFLMAEGVRLALSKVVGEISLTNGAETRA
jgi:predicted peroxiredoxin